jgi:dihydrofolate synthase/folylpolyglutamate synthase
MSYVAAVDHLHGLGLELGPSTPRRKFDLVHMRTLARVLGDPQTRFPSVLIAGTNGKGSTAATLASICSAAGLRVGLYTSPHLARVTERIRVAEPSASSPNNSLQEIDEEDFARLYFHVDETAQRLVKSGDLPHAPSFFESLTALTFLYFAQRNVQIAILEVGLGGRLDATNIVEPIISVITDIDLDHQEFLGNTIDQIAREKAGILRSAAPLVKLPQIPEADLAIAQIASTLNVRAVDASPFLPEPSSKVDGSEPISTLLRPNHYDISFTGERLQVCSPLSGVHQRRNLALAIATATELSLNGYNITNAAIEAGIANTSWPARLEFLPPNLLLDVAHNPAGASTLRAAILDLPVDQPRTLLFSCLRDKDLSEMARILFPLFDSARQRSLDHILFAPIENARASSIEDLLAAARSLAIPAQAANSTTQALALALSLTPANGLIVATGSIYLVGAVREAVLQL